MEQELSTYKFLQTGNLHHQQKKGLANPPSFDRDEHFSAENSNNLVTMLSYEGRLDDKEITINDIHQINEPSATGDSVQSFRGAYSTMKTQ